MTRLRICPTAQRLMDNLHAGGFRDQCIQNWLPNGDDGFLFSASTLDTTVEGEGTTPLKAIREAVSQTVFAK